MVKIKTSYISCACNRLPHVTDWGRNNLICYAANHSIVIYDPKAKKFGTALSTLHVHSDRVNVVRWIKPSSSEPETELLSASSDGTAIVWKATDLANAVFKPTDILRVNEPTNICDGIYFADNSSDLLICTGSTNGDFRLWFRFGNQEIEPLQILNFSKKLPIQARLALLPTELNHSPNLLLLLAMEDSTILLYSTSSHVLEDSNENKIGNFIHVQTLVGHEDWVTCMDYVLCNSQNSLIATGSQDNTIRLWKISRNTCINSENEKKEESLEIKQRKKSFLVHNHEYEIILESILIGHDAWIYGVHWHPSIQKFSESSQPLELLSCSLDKTAIVWKPSSNAGIWSETVRVGEVGGNSLGFYGCKFGPDGKNILTNGYHGSFHLWEYQETSQNWIPKPAPSGHYGGVMDLCWDQKGRFLLTASVDQTTRIHAPWPLENGEESWHEIGRPQIHGYEMSCLAVLKSYVFASGAAEKVVRIFTSPLTFKNYLQKITDDISDFDDEAMAEIASVPALGLTNKAIFDSKSCEEMETENYSRDLNYEEPPLEEDLVRQTLWPELQKLYGHGYEIYSMAARYDGTLLATSSKSTSPEHAAIILWDTKTWSQTQKLLSHQLTVTQLSFSPDDKYLLSVSRDRRWSLFKLENEKYELLVSSPQKGGLHTRIIWCCSWTNDSKYFATGSRDGKIGIWSKDIDVSQSLSPVTDYHNKDASITALAFAPNNVQDKFQYILAIGYESGCINISKVEQNDSNTYEWTQLVFLNSSSAHHLTVKRLAFRPEYKNQQKNVIQLASCGSDCIVKIHDLLLT